jgi:type IV secretory pathway VirB3-like protein
MTPTANSTSAPALGRTALMLGVRVQPMGFNGKVKFAVGVILLS